MNLEQMEYVKEILHTQSISLAAQNLHISQSAISQSLSLLEKELGVHLFKRSRLGTTPTEEGKNIIKKALEIVKKSEEIKEEALSINSSFKGELNIAANPALLMTFLPTISLFKKDFPQIKITIMEMSGKDVMEKLNTDTVDIGFINFGKEEPEHLICKPFYYQGELKVIVPKDSPLAYYEVLKIQDLLHYPFVIYASQSWENFIIDLKKKYGSINVLFTTTNSEVIKRTVSEGLAIGVLSSLMLKDDPYVESKRIIPISLDDHKLKSKSQSGCVYSKKSINKRVIEKFLEYLDSYMHQLHISEL